jgi:GGDEF domain-containing protein
MAMSSKETHTFEGYEFYDQPTDMLQREINMAGVLGIVAREARHDQLTGMLSKPAWKYELQERLGESDEPVGVILMDMDAFKEVNDTLGHGRGDSLIEQFGVHMRKHFRRQGDMLTHEKFILNERHEDDQAEVALGRMGGDEFGIFFDLKGNNKRVSSPEESMQVTMGYTRSIIDEFVAEQPEEIRALGFHVSIGNAMREEGEQIDAVQLLERADAAMYEEKRGRKLAS